MKNNVRKFLNSTRKNHDGKSYLLFNSKDRIKDLSYLEDVLTSMLSMLEKFVPKQYQNDLKTHFLTTFNRIQGIRIDETDEKLPPLCFTAQDMRKHHGGQLDKNGGVTYASVYDGIVLLFPQLKTEMQARENGDTSNNDGRHTVIHEFVHALSVWKEDFVKNGRTITDYVQGIRTNQYPKGIFDDLNEGITEYISQIIMFHAYPGCKVEKRYPYRVKLVEKIAELYEESELINIFSLYILGRGKEVLEKFANTQLKDGTSLLEYLDKNFYQRGIGLSNKNFDEDRKVYEEIANVIDGSVDNELEIE